jgi:Lar family restriction alleviation protein
MAENPIPLLPCPWCGSENVSLTYLEHQLGNDEHVSCNKCNAYGPGFDSDEPAAIAAWNKGPYADRFEIHAAALKAHADHLRAKAEEHLAKADELMKKAEAANG